MKKVRVELTKEELRQILLRHVPEDVEKAFDDGRQEISMFLTRDEAEFIENFRKEKRC